MPSHSEFEIWPWYETAPALKLCFRFFSNRFWSAIASLSIYTPFIKLAFCFDWHLCFPVRIWSDQSETPIEARAHKYLEEESSSFPPDGIRIPPCKTNRSKPRAEKRNWMHTVRKRDVDLKRRPHWLRVSSIWMRSWHRNGSRDLLCSRHVRTTLHAYLCIAMLLLLHSTVCGYTQMLLLFLRHVALPPSI